MAAKIALCVDELACRNPEIIGLAGENLELQSWLDIYVGGQEARHNVSGSPEVEEVWVASCDDVESINLAATLKRDRPELTVRLLEFEGGGSVLSRAHTAGIDEVMGRHAFTERYAGAKRAAAGASGAVDSVEDAQGAISRFSDGESGVEPFVGCRTIGANADSMRAMPDDGPSLSESSSRPFKDGGVLAGLLGLRGTGSVVAEQVSAEADLLHRQALLGLGITGVPATERLPAAVYEPHRSTLLTFERPEQKALPIAAFDSGPVRGKAFLMPVVSGSGGAGKSTIAVLAACIAQALGLNTLLLDLDLQFGDASMLLGIESPLAVDDLVAHPEHLSKVESGDAKPALVAPPARLEDAESVARDIPAVLDLVGPSYDVIVANTGASWAEQHAVLIERSNAVLFLIDQRSSSVRACRHALELCARCGIATGQFEFVLNRCSKTAPLTPEDVSRALQGAAVAQVRDGGREVEEYLAAGGALELMGVGNELCVSLRDVLGAILPGVETQAAKAASLSGGRMVGRRRGRHANKRKGWAK